MDKNRQRLIITQLRQLTILQRMGELLATNHIDYIVLKGAHLAPAYYPDITDRFFTDIDLLVRRTDVPRVTNLFRQNFTSFHTITEERSRLPYFRYNNGMTINNVACELHWDLSALKQFPLDLDKFFSNCEPYYVNRVKLYGLTPEFLLVSLCIHALKSSLQISHKHLRDVLQITTKRTLNWPLVLRLLTDAGALFGSYFFLNSAREQLHAPIPQEVLEQMRPAGYRYLLLKTFFEPLKPGQKLRMNHKFLKLGPILQDRLPVFINSCFLHGLEHFSWLEKL